MVSTIASYRMIAADMARSLERTAKEPQVAHETAYYQANIGKATTIEEFLGDYRLLSYALKAHGLADMAHATAFVRKLLTEGTADPDAFANKLSDSRYRDFAAAFDFARLGSDATRTAAAQSGTIEKYVRQTLEEQSGAGQIVADGFGQAAAGRDGMRLALYFQRKAPGITDAYQILADPPLLEEVRTSLGRSPLTSQANIDRQAETIASRIDFADFADADKLDAFIQRFAALWDAADPAAVNIAIPQVAIGQPVDLGLSADTLMTLQGLKRGNT
jgi:hypothetical protein